MRMTIDIPDSSTAVSMTLVFEDVGKTIVSVCAFAPKDGMLITRNDEADGVFEFADKITNNPQEG